MKKENDEELAIFCDRLKYYRKKQKMTQAQFSERIGVSEHYVRLIENGYSVPSVELFIQICKVLDVPAYNLLQSRNEALRYNKPNFYRTINTLDESKLKQILDALIK